MVIQNEERMQLAIQMKKEELRKQFISIYVGILQAIGVLIYCAINSYSLDWFYAFVFGLGALSGTFIFTSVFNLYAMMRKAEPVPEGNTRARSRHEMRETRDPIARDHRPSKRKPVRYNRSNHKRERTQTSEEPYNEEDVPPPDDEEYEEEEVVTVRRRKKKVEDELME